MQGRHSALLVKCVGFLQEYGRCEPRGGPLTGDNTVAAVVKARGGDGVEAFLVGSDGAARGADQGVQLRDGAAGAA